MYGLKESIGSKWLEKLSCTEVHCVVNHMNTEALSMNMNSMYT